uniref:Elongation factor Ts, mitochondrial n=1 Tax=Hildenbrandia rivularis TaxID=135206 RepID=A0A1C9CFD8_9FLOR|nr:elongation factor Ts [Hildenbrandia rivularis]AOM67101.1 elongation factor Ts [Hildenbrandia rivularis]
MVLQISARDVKKLRDKTGIGMMECKKALQVSNGDLDKAIENLRKKGMVIASQKSQRITTQGLIESYVHLGSKVGVMIELNCETDFVARRLEFQTLAKNIAMQIAANPSLQYIDKTGIPKDLIEYEYKIEFEQEDLSNKSGAMKQQVVEERVDKKLSELCLFPQPFIKNPEITVKDLVEQHILLLKENIKVRRFTRYILGDFIS